MKRLTLAILFSLTAITTSVQAEGSVHHSGQASKHTALAFSEGAASTAKVASAAVAVPLVVVGSASVVAGSVLVEAGDAFADSANHASHHKHVQQTKTLVITEKTITADPAPDKVIVIQTKTETKTEH